MKAETKSLAELEELTAAFRAQFELIAQNEGIAGLAPDACGACAAEIGIGDGNAARAQCGNACGCNHATQAPVRLGVVRNRKSVGSEGTR
jgi:hypothetical protein